MDATISKASPAAKPLSGVSLLAARLSLVSGATFLALLATLHFLRPDLDPSWRVISEYALGEYGWIMAVAFLAWGLSGVGLFVALRSQVRNLVGRIGLVFLLIGSVGPMLSAIFRMDPITTPPEAMTASGMIHSTGAALVDGFLVAATLLSLSLVRKNPNWSPVRKPLVGATILAWIGALASTVSMAVMLPQHGGQLGPEVLIGWPTRFVVVAYTVWLMTTAWCAIRVRSSQV